MTNLHDARVEAAAKAIADCHNEGQFKRYRESWIAEGRAALAAADALVTVEMIADALRSIPDAEPGDRRDPATVIAEYLHSSLFGEVSGDDSLLLIGQ